jgi:hypothetical protein
MRVHAVIAGLRPAHYDCRGKGATPHPRYRIGVFIVRWAAAECPPKRSHQRASSQ